MYNQKTLEIFKNPTNAGGLQGANGISKKENQKFGDVVKIYLKINENEIVEQARFKTMGCVASIACSSVATEIISKKSLDEVKNLSIDDILDIVGKLPEEKLCLVSTVVEAVYGAVEDYYKKKEKEQKLAENR